MACGFSMFFLFWQMFLFQVLHPVWLNVIHFFIIRIILSCILLSLLLLLYLWLYFKDDYIIVFFPFPWLFFCKISILILMQGCYNFLLKFSQHFCLKLVYFPAIFLIYIYIYIYHFPAQKHSKHIKFQQTSASILLPTTYKFQAYLPLLI